MMSIDVEMKLRWWNANYVGTHFGGSLFAMTDAFYMLMVMAKLGKELVTSSGTRLLPSCTESRERAQCEQSFALPMPNWMKFVRSWRHCQSMSLPSKSM